VIGLGAALGVALRWYVLAGPFGGFDSDEAVSAMVSTEARHGNFLALIPGARAGGTLLAYPRAVVFAIFGNDELAAKLCEVAVFALACVVVWRAGRRIFDERHAQLAALILWVFPAAAVWDSTKVRLYYTTAVFFVAASLLAALRLHDHHDPRSTPAVRDAALVGLLGGLCLWNHPMALYAFIPIFGWLLVVRPRTVRRTPVIIGAAVVGALPWLWFNAGHDWLAARQPIPLTESTPRDRFEGFFRSVLPRLTGFRDHYDGPWFFSPLSKVVYVVLVVLGLVTALRWRGRRRVLAAVAIAYPVLFAIPRNSVFVAEPRYGLPLLPALVFFEAALVLWIVRRHLAGVAAALVVLALCSALALHALDDRTEPNRVALTVLRPVSTDDVWRTIEERHLTTAFADYWLAYRLVFEDRTPVAVIPLSNDYFGLAGKHQEGSSVGFFYRDSVCVQRWLAVLSGMNVTPRTEDIGDYVLVETPTSIPTAVVAGAMSGAC
jgi:4-amino-4-deoxy-L-arabinose transferase-like glycosyltransferase